ncbi:cell division topological specificity factor [uncultured Thiomicrorhabdus sp.]
MRDEILQVIAKYVEIDQDQLKINIDEENGFEVLELNLVLPDEHK